MPLNRTSSDSSGKTALIDPLKAVVQRTAADAWAALDQHTAVDQRKALYQDTAANQRKVLDPRKAVILSEAKNPRISSTGPILPTRRSRLFATLLTLTLALSGCHSAYINATVSNTTAAPISVVQVEYPTASFGTQTIAPGADFHYRFKILGTGSMKITWTDTAQHEQKATGPTLTEGTEGALTITVAPDGVHWQSPTSTH